MRFEDKEVEGPDYENELERESELEREDEEEMPQIEPEERLDARGENQVIAAMRAILERRTIIVNDLKLPQREIQALEALKAAVSGRDGKLDQFVYATDRRDMLEQALAVLQPELVHDVDHIFVDLVGKIGSLRNDLRQLEDGQDELLEANPLVGVVVDGTDTADKPAPKPTDDDASLDGPERKLPPKPATSLTGAEINEVPFVSTLDGPAIKEVAKPASSLGGPDVKEAPAPKSTLDGPALPDAPDQPTSLGSPEEVAKAAEALPEPQKQKSKPWWKRAFGSE